MATGTIERPVATLNKLRADLNRCITRLQTHWVWLRLRSICSARLMSSILRDADELLLSPRSTLAIARTVNGGRSCDRPPLRWAFITSFMALLPNDLDQVQALLQSLRVRT